MKPPCPRVLGLPAAFNGAVEARIRRIAGEVGAPRAPPCRASNVFVLVTDQPQQLLDAVDRKRPRMLGFHYAAQTERLTTFKGPIQAWYVTATGGRYQSTAVLDEEFIQTPGGRAGSRLSAGVTSRFEAVLIIVDVTQVAGQPIGKIAEGVAMLSLARSPVTEKCRELATILDALRADCASSADLDGLSTADKAYLVGLYQSDAELLRSRQKSTVARSVRRQLEAER